MRKIILSFIFLSVVLLGCTRDDICPDGTATTPMLIIKFKDKNNPEKLKKILRLSVEIDFDVPVEIIPKIETDSIALPLDINSDQTRYRLIRTTYINDSTNIVDVSRIELNYTRQELYVNRACGFKMQFNNLTGSIINDPTNQSWIQNIEVLRDTVNDESKAHISIFH